MLHKPIMGFSNGVNKTSPLLKSPDTVYPVLQAPIFISFFIALREMANLPVPSLQTGGLWWFQDLTLSDPIYVLPLVVTATMWAVLEVSPGSPSACPVEWGVKGKQLYRMVILHSLKRENWWVRDLSQDQWKLTYICLSNACSPLAFSFFSQLGAETGMQSSDLQWMRNFIRLMPLAVLPITVHFPTVGDGLGAGFKSPSKLPRDAASECFLFSSRQCSCTGSPPTCFPWARWPVSVFLLFALCWKFPNVLCMTQTSYLHGKAS